MRVDSAPDGGKFRAKAAAALDGIAATFGDGFIVVNTNASGELIRSAAVGDALGVIFNPEGVKPGAHYNSTTNPAKGGRWYTVLTFAICTEVGSEFAAGDRLYASTNGAVTTTPAAGAVYIGEVLADGETFVLNVNGRPAN